MSEDSIFVSGVGVHLPTRMEADQAQALGLVDALAVRRTAMRSVCVSKLSGPEMAVRAARAALADARVQPQDITLVLHASTYYQGHDLWAPASYIAQFAVGNAGLSVDVNQLSNGGMAALELAQAHLRGLPESHSALITTGDRFCPPGFDRWNSDPGTVCGDGGTALVLSRAGGFARLLSLVTVSDPELERMGRGDVPFGDVALAHRPISIEAQRASALKRWGMSTVLERLRQGQRESFERALKQSGLSAGDIDLFVPPNLGRPRMQFQFFEPLGIDAADSTWGWGSTVGHLGAGDQAAGLAHLRDTGALTAGRRVALLGAGGGFAWSTAILEVSSPGTV